MTQYKFISISMAGDWTLRLDDVLVCIATIDSVRVLKVTAKKSIENIAFLIENGVKFSCDKESIFCEFIPSQLLQVG